MPDKLGNISSDAVQKATGKSWGEWIAILDKHDAEKLTHKEIVKVLSDQGVPGWWRQMIAVGYEQARGKRVTGQTATGFQIGVSRTLPITLTQVWEFITSRNGQELWLGKSAGLKFVKGEPYFTEDGIAGEVRVYQPNHHLRITWKPSHWQTPSTLQIRVTPKGNKTVISFHHEKLPGENEHSEMRDHWKSVLDRLTKSLVEK